MLNHETKPSHENKRGIAGYARHLWGLAHRGFVSELERQSSSATPETDLGIKFAGILGRFVGIITIPVLLALSLYGTWVM